MGIQVFFTLTFAFLLLHNGAESVSLTMKNNCQFTIWPATQTGANNAQLPATGFELQPQASRSVEAPKPWTAGRIWARTECSGNPGAFRCATADCGSGQETCDGKGGATPASLAEFTIEANGKQDTYDISLVDGFNLPIAIAPQGGTGECKAISCGANINSVCPQNLAVKAGDGRVIACKSACAAFNTPEYCCTASFNDPNTCKATQFSKIFKDQCPDAYSFAYNDQSSTFTCTDPSGYVITFCP